MAFTALEIVLRSYPAVGGLEQSTRLIASFIGLQQCMTLSDACEFGSLPLLEWIWDSSPTTVDGREARWSPRNYLRSDKHYYAWQFQKSLEVAAGRGDVDVVAWLLSHFPDYAVPNNVVELAAENGHLPVLQYLLACDSSRKGRSSKDCTEDCAGLGASFPACKAVAVSWGNRDMEKALESGHSDVVKWLYEFTSHANTGRDLSNLIVLAINFGELEVAKMLLPPGKSIVDYSCDCPCLDTIEWLLKCGHLHQNLGRASSAIVNAACGGHLPLVQQILQLYTPPPTTDPQWLDACYDALCAACRLGDLRMLRWLLEYLTECGVCKDMDHKREINQLLKVAASGDHTDILEFLYSHGGIDPDGTALLHAVQQGQLQSVKWLNDHFAYTNKRLTEMVDAAAAHGHVEILQYFHSVDMNLAATTSKRKFTRGIWPDARYVLDTAVKNGQLAVMKWLHVHRYEGCTDQVLNYAIINGHLDALQWLLENTRAACRENMMDTAAEYGHLDILKWLHTNRSKRCSAKAIKEALGNGHVRVACYLSKHFPDRVPSKMSVTTESDKIFEVLLFIEAHYRKLVTPSFAKKARLDWHPQACKWLNEKCPRL